jgi:HTH-type transcriptional regulator/antitoxin HigA
VPKESHQMSSVSARIHPIRTEADYEGYVREIDALLESAEPGSAEEDRLDVLATLVNAYEDEHYTMLDAVSPLELLKAVMTDRGLTQADLARVVGSRSRASEILSAKRGLSVDQIRAIRDAWKIPADALI